jgi:histone-lysine N-methyltransferase SETMAR
MEKKEFRVLIKHYYLRGKTISETKEKLKKYYCESAPSHGMIHKWFTEFRCGRTSTTDAERSGRPIEVTNEEMINKIHDIVLEDRRVKVREIVNMVNISSERVCNILHEHLCMKKLSARWVPRLLTVDQKRNRVTMSKQCLDKFQRNPSEFLRRYVTMDETWIHYYTPETKEQSKQWTSSTETAPKKAKTVPSAGKVMASVFWDSKGIIHIDYLEKGKTVTGQYYADLLHSFNAKLRKKRPHLSKKKVLFHHDNAPAHTSAIATAKLFQLRYELVPHPPYSPDLAPSDFFLFPNLKKWLSGRRFYSNDEIINATNEYFDDLQTSYFLKGLEKLEHRWKKCIAVKGDYVEK